MNEILKLDGWKGDQLRYTYIDSCLKCLEDKASKLHNEIDSINKVLAEGIYWIQTSISGSEKEHKFKLKIKVKSYGNRAKHEHKKNTHRQKINI